jgi:hypothetical protein
MPTSRESLITVLYGSSATTAPSDLYDGELAFANGSGSNKKLFVGSGGNNTSNWVGAIIEDQAAINWSSVSSENNKLATQYAVKSLAGNYLPLSGGSLTGDLTLGTTSEIVFTARGNGGGTVILQAPTATTSNAAYTFTLPVNDGDAAEVLTTDGNGVLSWSSTGTATNVSVTNDDATTTAYIAFTNATSGATAVRVDSNGLTYNSLTDTLTIAGDLAVNGDTLTIAGDLAVNGGGLTTSAATFNLLDSTVATLNLGGAATAITMGDSTIATTVIRGGTLVGNLTTQHVFNNTATTVNAFGAATAVTIGSTSTGVAHIRNSTLKLGNTNAYVTTNSGSNYITIAPTGTLALSTTSSVFFEGSVPLIKVNSGNGSTTDFLGGDIYLGTKQTDDLTPVVTPVNIIWEGVTSNGFETTLTVADPTADRTITLPDATGTVALVAGSDTQVMFNDGGSALGGDSGLTYNKTTDTLTITGDLAVNGGGLTTSAATFNLLNGTATTLNIGGAATAITMGDSTTATINLRGGTLVGNATTQNVFNTTATTVNAFGAATTLGFGYNGASSATTGISNGATGNGFTNTINMGANGASGSTTNVNIGSAAGGTVAFGYNATVGNNLTVTGDLTVNGTAVTVNTSILSVEDPLIKLANGNSTADSVDIGFYGLYDTSGSLDLYCGLFRDASDGKFRLFVDSQSEPSTTVNTSATGYTVGTLIANIRGGIFT